MKQEQPSSQLDKTCTAALVRQLPEQPHRSWPAKYDRGDVRNPLCGKKCSPQPKNPEDDEPDGKGLIISM